MATIPQTPLFRWEDIETRSDLDRLCLVLLALSDEPLMKALERHRGRGRDDYPVRPTWNAILAGIVFQHPSIASLRRELLRNGELRALCGFDIHAGTAAVPSEDAFSRFLKLLARHQHLLEQMFHDLVDQLKQVLPDLGKKLAVDSKAIPSFGRPVSRRKGKQGAEPAEQDEVGRDGRRDMDADWGTKTYKGTRADGTLWEKSVRWFGYKLHVLADSVHELPLAFSLTQASSGDSPELLPLLEALHSRHPEVARDAQDLAADKAYDAHEIYRRLWQDYGIKALIDTRSLWKEDADKPRVLFPERADVFLYDERGQVYCQCPSERRGEDEVRPLFFCGFEKDRGTLKYRCPAAATDGHCPGRAECEANAKVGPYGRVVRVPLERDPRIFTPIARHTRKWRQGYARRSAVERINARIDRVLGFEQHTIRGMQKMKVRLSLSLCVMLAMALGRIRIGQHDRMRSMTAPIARAA